MNMADWAPFYGAFDGYVWSVIVAAIVILVALCYVGKWLWLWFAVMLAALYVLGAPALAIAILAAVSIVLSVPPVRRTVISGPLMHLIKRMGLLPVISETERTAIEAGTVWVEGELFSGKPNWPRMLSAA